MSHPDTMNAKCGAKGKTGKPCARPAGAGTDHKGVGRCKHHGGATPNHQKHAARLTALSLAEAMAAADGPDLHPEDALLMAVKVQHGMVMWARGMVAELTNTDATGPVGGGGDAHPRYEPHVLIRLRGEEEDRLVKLIKTCHDIGIAERQVRLMERMGDDLAEFARGILEDFGLSGDPRAPEIVRRRMMLLASVDGTARDAA
jgi:hypothetical protein